MNETQTVKITLSRIAMAIEEDNTDDGHTLCEDTADVLIDIVCDALDEYFEANLQSWIDEARLVVATMKEDEK
jgi:hypothetical protein